MQLADEISALEDNERFLRHLMVSVLKKKSLISRLKTY